LAYTHRIVYRNAKASITFFGFLRTK